MKKLFCTIVVIMVFGLLAIAQDTILPANPVEGLKAEMVNNNFELSWQGGIQDGTGAYWQVEGSSDGKTFKTVGYVWGSENGNCIFRQNSGKLIKGFIYYRVLSVKDAGTAIASHAIRL
ncbi:MAG: hypothetical protein ABIW38_14740 [Ferruginibacter sp.]